MKIDHKESIEDFGNQFLIDSNIDDYWGSNEMLKDIVSPFDLKNIENKIIMEVGSGSGRIIKNLLKYSPKQIIAIEPSKAIEVAKNNNQKNLKKINFLNIKGEDIKFENELDFVFSLGVIHHIPNGNIVCKRIFQSLKPNGKFLIWLYGHEGNELYLLIFNNLRRMSRLIPDFFLRFFCYFLNLLASIYILFCLVIKLPMKDYMLNVFRKCSFRKRNYIIFDQLNPSFSKYYKKIEVEELLKDSGFKKIKIYNRHNYSWFAIAEK